MYSASQEEINQLQEIMIEMLFEVDRICKRHNITYFLDSGSALGAVRHGGFIPWDDDLDIGMLREDYEKFLLVAKMELSSNFALQIHETEPLYNNFHAKIRKLNTFYPQSYTAGYKYRGFQLDVFPFDKVPNDYGKANNVINMSRWVRCHICDIQNAKLSKNPIKAFVQILIKIVFKPWYRSLFEHMCQKYNNTDSELVTSFTYRMTRTKNYIFPLKDIIPTKDICFNGYFFPIMNNPDAYLRIMYGDYMQLPPENKRECHLVGKPIFDTTK